MEFYLDISWESRCSSEIKVWGHLCQILVVLAIFRHPFHCYILIPRKCPLKTPLHSAPPYLDRSVNPMSTRWGGADYAHQILLPPKIFWPSDIPESLTIDCCRRFSTARWHWSLKLLILISTFVLHKMDHFSPLWNCIDLYIFISNI